MALYSSEDVEGGIADSAEEAFERRISAIHGVSRASIDGEESGGLGMDLRRTEMLAMIESFLGLDYDRAKVIRLLELQDHLHERQAKIYEAYDSHRMPAKMYVEMFNHYLRRDLMACEQLLGPEDFNRLFGCELSEAQGFIELDAFLASEAERVGSPLASDRTLRSSRGRDRKSGL